MWRMIFGQLRARRGRSLALLGGIAAATAAFAVFTGDARTQQLVVRGKVAHSFRGSYDILVRPRGTETPIERSERLVRDNYLSGIFGGITLAQYHEVEHTPGVQVAAPIAMVGYVLQPVSIVFNLTKDLDGAARQLFSVQVTRVTDRGLVRLTDQRGYVYATRDVLKAPGGSAAYADGTEIINPRKAVTDCPETVRANGSATSAFDQSERAIAFCISRKTGFYGLGWSGFGVRKSGLGFFIRFPFPFLLAAVDPAAETRLDGVGRTIVTGRYLHDTDAPRSETVFGTPRIAVPVIVSTRPYLDDQDEVVVRELTSGAANATVNDRSFGEVERTIARARPGSVVMHRSVGIGRAYAGLLQAIRHQQIAVVQNYWSSGAARYRRLGARTVAPIPVRNPPSVWRSDYMASGFVDAPIDSSLTAFRPLRPHVGIGGEGRGVVTPGGQQSTLLPSLRAVGTFDPDKLPGFGALSQLPQETYYPPVAAPGNARTRRLLHGLGLMPDGNLGGYLQPPPLLLTDLKSLPAFTNPKAFPRADRRAPVSVIRVRVAGVHGDNALSRERIRIVAQRIEQTTHLQVDITAGSSPTSMRVDLPASSHTPSLQLSERWVREGVAEAILSALDKQSLVLFVLILVVGATFVYNAAAASVQARRVQFGMLKSLGWNDRTLFRLIVGEQAVIGLVAGLLGFVIAIPVSSAAGFHAGVAHALLAIPAAIVLAVFAALIPAARAGRVTPIDALRPAVPRAGRARHVGSVQQLALVNIARAPLRSLLAATSLASGVGALTVLVAITAVFHNALTGSLLGSAISLQVRGLDYAAVIVLVVLASAAIGDVLYLSVRERAAELATLQATGWSERTIGRLMVLEALWIGLAGSVAGAILGVLAASTFAAALPHQLIVVAALSAAAGVAVAALAALAPTVAINRMATVPILAAD